jgi:hypothetical protein
MVEPQMAVGVAKSAQAASRMLTAGSSPLVMVRHGRREDRAAVYDRFVLACARCLRAGDGDGVEDVWATWTAIDLRCRPSVRKAAGDLAGYTLAVADPHDSGSFYRDFMDIQFVASDLPWADEPYPGARDYKTEGAVMLSYLTAFVKSARADLNRRWWNAPVWAWRDVTAWFEERKEKRERSKRHKEQLTAYRAAAASTGDADVEQV